MTLGSWSEPVGQVPRHDGWDIFTVSEGQRGGLSPALYQAVPAWLTTVDDKEKALRHSITPDHEAQGGRYEADFPEHCFRRCRFSFFSA